MSGQGPLLAQLHDELKMFPKENRDPIQKELDDINRTRSIKKLRTLGYEYKRDIEENASRMEDMIKVNLTRGGPRAPVVHPKNKTTHRRRRNALYYPNDVDRQTRRERRLSPRKYASKRVRAKNRHSYEQLNGRTPPLRVRDNRYKQTQVFNDAATDYKYLKTYNGILKVIDNLIDQKIQRLKDDGVVENEDESAEEAEAEETEEAEAEDTEEAETEEAEAEEVEEEEAEADPRTRTGGNRRKKNKTAKKRPKRRASRTPRRQ
jgi:hypothetical protein